MIEKKQRILLVGDEPFHKEISRILSDKDYLVIQLEEHQDTIVPSHDEKDLLHLHIDLQLRLACIGEEKNIQSYGPQKNPQKNLQFNEHLLKQHSYKNKKKKF